MRESDLRDECREHRGEGSKKERLLCIGFIDERLSDGSIVDVERLKH